MYNLNLSPEKKRIATKMAKNYGYDSYMVERYISFLGIEETKQYLDANERKLNPSIRVNELKINSPELLKILNHKGFKLKKIEDIPYGFEVLNEVMNLGSLHEFLQGYYYLQDKASMVSPLVLNPKSTDFVIDMAASPGSKATQLAQLMRNQGRLLLIEKNYERLESLKFNLRRMGVKNSVLINMNSESLLELNLKADKILLDAPCTGEGLIRKDSSRKKSRNMEDIFQMQKIQKSLLDVGLESLNPNGQLLYSTCSIAPEENEFVLDMVLKEKQNFKIEKFNLKMGSHGLTSVYGKTLNRNLKHARRLYPHKDDTIGFFLCLIKKF